MPANGSQSRFMSLLEAVTNVIVGYVLAIATQIVVFPWFGIKAGVTDHLTIGLAFVGVSLLRGYLLRRLFEAVTHPARFGGRQPLPPSYTRFPSDSGRPRER
jgi:hypothetical protein